MTWQAVGPPQPVEIRDGERWVPGLLEGWMRDEAGWWAYVHFEDETRRVAIVIAEDVRLAEEPS